MTIEPGSGRTRTDGRRRDDRRGGSGGASRDAPAIRHRPRGSGAWVAASELGRIRQRGGTSPAARATVGFWRNAINPGAFVEVHITISVPFHTNPIGTTRGVPSRATYASRVTSRARSSRLLGRRRTSTTSFSSTVNTLPWSDLTSPSDEIIAPSPSTQPAATTAPGDPLADHDDLRPPKNETSRTLIPGFGCFRCRATSQSCRRGT
jgi:hypothetical protein